MPLERCTKDGTRGWRWGSEGTCYTGDGARRRALNQGIAIGDIDVSKSDELLQFPIAKALRVSKDGERKNLVFGWAMVPHPATVEKAHPEGSVEADLEALHEAFDDAHPIDRDLGNWQWVIATFPTNLIVERRIDGDSTLFRVSYARTDDGEFTFGQLVEVEQTFVEKALATGELVVETPRPEPKEDLQGDTIEIPDLEEAAYRFVLTSRQADVRHAEVPVGTLVESFLVTDEKLEVLGLDEDARADVSKGWWLGFQVDDETMDRVESGELAMFSVGGNGLRVPVAAAS